MASAVIPGSIFILEDEKVNNFCSLCPKIVGIFSRFPSGKWQEHNRACSPGFESPGLLKIIRQLITYINMKTSKSFHLISCIHLFLKLLSVGNL